MKNLSEHDIDSTIHGATPPLGPGVMPAGRGKHLWDAKVIDLLGPVALSDTLGIVWEIEPSEMKNRASLKPADFGVPRKIRGGELRIKYTAKGTWKMSYVPYPKR